MNSFTDIIAKLKGTIDAKNNEKDVIIACIKEVVGVTITADAITYKDSAIRITAPATLKMAIKLQQTPLMEAFVVKGIKVISIT